MNSRHRSKEKLVPIWKEIHFLLTFFLWNTEFLKWVVTPETDVHPILQMCSLFHRVGKETKSQDYQVKYFFIKQMHEHTFRCKTTSLPFHTKLPEKKKVFLCKIDQPRTQWRYCCCPFSYWTDAGYNFQTRCP